MLEYTEQLEAENAQLQEEKKLLEGGNEGEEL